MNPSDMAEAGRDAAVLIVVVNDPADLARVRDEGWYRIPLARAPQRIAADYLAFYQTAAFPPDERWQVQHLAPVSGYYLATRRELIPEEPDHPRADALYYRVALGPLQPLPRPIPSRRLRRITFIASTLERLYAASEINDLWIRSSAHERLWKALQEADLEAEYQYPLGDAGEDEEYAVDFALPCRRGAVAIMLDEAEESAAEVREARLGPDYLMAALGWPLVRIPLADLDTRIPFWTERLSGLCADLGGLS